VLLLFVAYLPFGNLFNTIFPISLMGVSIFTIVFPLLAMLILSSYAKISTQAIRLIAFLVIVLLVKIIRGILIISEPENLILIYDFQLYIIPLSLIIFQKTGLIFNKNVDYVLISILIFQVVNALLYSVGFTALNLLTVNHSVNYSRFVGIFGGANVNSNFNILIVTILVLANNNRSVLKNLFYVLLGLISIIPSNSRGPLFIITVLLLYTVMTNNIKGVLLGALVTFISIINIRLIFSIIENNFIFIKFINSFIYNLDVSRQDKYAYGYDLLTTNIQSFLIGVERSRLSIGESFNVSDNSFLQISLAYGVPVLILYLILILALNRRDSRRSASIIIYLLIIIFTTFVNNSLGWIPWMVYAAMGYGLINDRAEISVQSDKQLLK
jgi:hypothetical protein